MEEYIDAAKKYAKRYLSHTEDYKNNIDNDYYYIAVFSQHLARKSMKDPKVNKIVRKAINDFRKASNRI